MPEAPAATLAHFAATAREEVQPGLSGQRFKTNASRDAHSFINKWGLTWKVPQSYVEVEHDGEQIKFAYIKPTDFLKYVVTKAPDVLMGGCPEIEHGKDQLQAFWKSYYHVHPTHRMFQEQHAERSFSNTFALAIHGDEGRGLKKANTTILMMETCLGLDSWSNWINQKSTLCCKDCSLDEPTKKRIRLDETALPSAGNPACFQSCNLKHHSFLTKFVLAALPNKNKELLDAVMIEIVRDFNSLFDDGFSVDNQSWFAACTGSKGDLKWVQRIAGLERSFGSQISINKPMCHECCAGTQELPFECSDHKPAWGPTCFTVRPFSVRPVITHIPFEHENNSGDPATPHERFFRRDIFHNTKMGVYRDFIASAVLLLCKLHYFDEDGATNSRDVLLERAFYHFRWFCKTTGRTPALRSFSLSFFNSPKWAAFPWVNCKGSDTSLLLAWVHTLVVGFLNDPLKNDHVVLLRQMARCAEAARNLQRICYSHHLWMSKLCGATLYNEMHAFARNYNACAFLSMHKFGYTGFAMKSKYHLICHAKYELLILLQSKEVALIPNLQMFGCEMNEDVVGKLSRLIRRVSARHASSRALQLYLTKAKAVHRKFKKQQGKIISKKVQGDLGSPAD